MLGGVAKPKKFATEATEERESSKTAKSAEESEQGVDLAQWSL
jgi:hypothetical protein